VYVGGVGTDGKLHGISVDDSGVVQATVSGTVSANCTQTTSPWVVSNGGTFAVQAAISGSISNTSFAVTNTGTFAVQAACTGTVSANCTQTTSPWVVSNGGTFATQDSNLSGCIGSSKVNVNISSGNPTTIACTNTGTFAVQAAISGSISNTSFIATQGIGSNLHTVVDSGTVDVGSVGGTVTVAQITSPPTPWAVSGTLATNLNPPSTNNLGVLPALASQVAPIYVEGSQILLSTDLTGAVRTVLPQTTSVMGDLVSVDRRNQYDINFSGADATNAALLTNSSTGGGAVAQANGLGIYSAGATPSTAGDAKGVSVQLLEYRPGFDAYAYFTAAFVAPTDSNAAHNFVRIGLYGATDGFYVGFEGNVFSASVRQNSADSHVGQGSFNRDKLTGSTGSRFTRNGVVEAVNFAYLNLYRVRFSWFGAAPIVYEILTPDDVWIPFQEILQPNTSSTPSIYTTLIPFTGEAFKSVASASANVQFSSGCWAVGTTSSDVRLNDAVIDSNTAELVRAVITGKGPSGYANVAIDGADNLYVSVYNMPGIASPGATGNAGSLLEAGTLVNSSAPSYSNNTIEPLSLDTAGNLRTVLNAETSKVIGTVRNLGNAGAAFDAATGATVPANAIQVGGLAKTALPTAASDGQLVAPLADKFGRQAVVLQGDRALTTPFSYQSTAASPATMIASGGTGVFTDITELILTNESATATIVSISDGTIAYNFALAANGGLTKTFATPLKATSAATAWTVSNSSAVNVDCVGVVIDNK
jgi:hypothetical protein